jgi:hypothetical protein
MENEDTEYKNDDDDSFIQYVFGNKPKEKSSIKLELGTTNDNINKHIYEQLLQIFTDGLKFLYGKDNNKVDISTLEIENILLMKDYFSSFGIELQFNMYDKDNYVFKPYIYNIPNLYKKIKSIDEFYYEVQINKDNNLLFYRISFDYL